MDQQKINKQKNNFLGLIFSEAFLMLQICLFCSYKIFFHSKIETIQILILTFICCLNYDFTKKYGFVLFLKKKKKNFF